jgi:phosphohistidine swiveling domain-containing protein
MMAKAVVTEQGGVTSHAALVSRELDIPTAVGVTDFLHTASDGDQITVDAQRGIVQIEQYLCYHSSDMFWNRG